MKVLFTLFMAMAITQAAQAGALGDKTKWEPWEKKIQASVDHAAMPDQCGKAVTVNVDKASFKDDSAIKTGGWCSAAVDGLSIFCHAHAKDNAEIMNKVHTVKCSYNPSLKAAGSKTHGMQLDLSNGTLQVSWSKDSSNVADETKKYLEAKL